MRYISLFSGIEAATVAWKPLGWEAVAYSEIDPFPKAVLAHHYPDVPDLGDMTKIDWRKYRGTADIVVGGSPCQAFSIAGLRKALDDPRGQLMLEYLRACHEIDPEWIVWENVPGVLSADHGRAFGSLLASVAELWPHGGAAWRVLDAQFFGVAQRRRRVFLVVNARDWRRAAPVLFERESLRWDYKSSKEARKALAARSDASAGATARSIDFNPTAGRFRWAEDPTLMQTLTEMMSTGGGKVPPVYCGHEPVAIAGNIIGRQPGNGGNGLGYETDGAMYTLTATDVHGVWCAGDSGTNMPCYRDMSPALTAHDENSACFVNAPYCATDSGSPSVGHGMVPTLTAHDGKSAPFVNAPSTCIIRSGKEGGGKGALVQRDMSATPTTSQQQTLFTGGDGAFSVRRLTPIECERLQGFPDGYTDVPWRGKAHAPDSKRYKALGNSMAVPVMRWIGEGIELVNDSGR